VFFHLLCIEHAKRTQKKFKPLYWEKLENKIKVEHKKFKLLCLRTCIFKNEKELEEKQKEISNNSYSKNDRK